MTIIYTCGPSGMVPLDRFREAYRAEFTAGELYRLEGITERSWKSHAHYFACIHDYWLNLPEDIAHEFPSSEHLRKYALIKTGWYNAAYFPMAGVDAAKHFSVYHRKIDVFSIVTVDGPNVTIFTAKSQKTRGPERMDKEDFQKSKTDVLEFLDGMIGVAAGAVEANVGTSA